MQLGFTPEEVFASLCSFSPLDKQVPLLPLVPSRKRSERRGKRRPHELFLDALAVLCVRSDGNKTINVSLAIEPYSNNQLKLYIAADEEVSPDLVTHIHTIWSYLPRLAEEQDPAEAFKSIASNYSVLVRELIFVVYSFVWTKLQRQVRKHSKSVLNALQRLLLSLCSAPSDNEFRYELMEVLGTLLKFPDETPPHSSDLDAMYRLLRRISRRMSGKAPEYPPVTSSTIEAWEASMNGAITFLLPTLDGVLTLHLSTILESGTEIPFVRHVKKITRVSDSIADVQNTIICSSRIRKMCGVSLEIVCIPREFRRFSINIASPSLFLRYRMCATYRISYADFDQGQMSFEEYARMLWDLDVIQPVNERLGHLRAGNGGFYHDHVPVHSECTLVRYLLIHNISSIPYVGCSRDACLGCWAFTHVVNHIWHTEIGLRGCSGKVVIPHVFSHYPLHSHEEEYALGRMLSQLWDTAWEIRRYPAFWEGRREDY